MVSFKVSRGPLFPKPVFWVGLYFGVTYSKPALVKHDNTCDLAVNNQIFSEKKHITFKSDVKVKTIGASLKITAFMSPNFQS